MSSVPVQAQDPPCSSRMLNIIKTGQHGTHLYSHSEVRSFGSGTGKEARLHGCGQQTQVGIGDTRGVREHSTDAKYRRWTISEHALERLYYMTPSKLIVTVHGV